MAMGTRRTAFLFIVISALLHTGFLALLFWPEARAKDNSVSIYIEYRKAGDGKVPENLARNLPAVKTPAAHKVATEQADQGEAAEDSAEDQALGGSDSLAISGVELGIHANYPRLSRVLGEKGQVLIGIQKGTDGSVNPPIVAGSSGFSRLDQSALSATREALSQGLLASLLENRNQLKISFIFKLSGTSEPQE